MKVVFSSATMNSILCLFFALLNGCYTAAGTLTLPVSLSVLRNDLELLSDSCLSGDVLKNNPIRYDSELYFNIRCERKSGAAGTKSVLVLDGKVTIASASWSQSKQQYKVEKENAELFFRGSVFYYKNPLDGKVFGIANSDDKYIVKYDLPDVNEDEYNTKSPTIEYSSREEFVNKLKTRAYSQFQYEARITGAEILYSTFILENGSSLKVLYNRRSAMAIFTGKFFVVKKNEEKLLGTVLDTIYYDFGQKSSEQLNPNIRSIRALSYEKPPFSKIGNALRLYRDVVLTDMMTSFTVNPQTGTGAVNFEIYGQYTMDNWNKDGLIFIRLNGPTLMPDGTETKSLCLYNPTEEEKGKKHKPLFFPCDPNQESQVFVLLQNYDDYIGVDVKDHSVLYRSHTYTSMQPYIQYISFGTFYHTLKLITEALKLRCPKKGASRIPHKMFGDVAFVFDCDSNIATFETFEAYVLPNTKSAVGMLGKLTELTYDLTDCKVEINKTPILFKFTIRQVYRTIDGEIPLGVEFEDSKGKKHTATSVESLLYDMKSIRERLLHLKIGPKAAVVFVDNYVLFAGRLRNVGTSKKTTTVLEVLGERKVIPENRNSRPYLQEHRVYHDGEKLNNDEMVEETLSELYWLKNRRLSIIEQAKVSIKEQYVTLSTFRNDMRELSGILRDHCSEYSESVRGPRFTVFYKYSGGKNSAVGYYHCKHEFFFFYSDFKAIKYPEVSKNKGVYGGREDARKVDSFLGSEVSSQNRELIFLPEKAPSDPKIDLFRSKQTATVDIPTPEKSVKRFETYPNVEDETWIEWAIADEDELRNRYPQLIVKDLLFYYDRDFNYRYPKRFSSRGTTPLNDVYALKCLSCNDFDSLIIGYPLKKTLTSGARVYVYGETEDVHSPLQKKRETLAEKFMRKAHVN